MTEIDDKRKAEIAREYETLRMQDQDEPSIVKVLCAKYSVDKATLDKLVEEARQGGAPKGPAQPAGEDQMGRSPPKGTVQSGKEPKTS